MSTLNFIIRGFLYKENWRPLSTRNKKGSYTINFIKCHKGYSILFNRLAEKFNAKLYFSTYSSTPDFMLNYIRNNFSSASISFSDEARSSQFTTSINILNKIKNDNKISDYTIVIRSDLILTENFINLILSSNFDNDRLSILCKEANSRDRSVDIIHIVPKMKYDEFLKFISRQPRDAHRIHKHILTKSIITQHNCVAVKQCGEFFKIYDET